MTKRVIVVDGDTIAFRAASACQHTLEGSQGYVTPFAIRAEGETIVDNMMFTLQKRLGADETVVFLSCKSEDNWRYQVAESYKANRKGSVRPLLLNKLKDYMRLKYQASHMKNLEADDAIGIYLTEPHDNEKRIAVGRDKDFAQIPGFHYQLGDDDVQGKPCVREITPLDALKLHYAQILAGDAVDGYAGCPGIGMVGAERIIDEPTRLVPKQGVITRGKNKGSRVVKWHSTGPSSMWDAVVSQYQKAGLTEQDATITARLAHILHHKDYNQETHEITLWVPTEGI